MKSKSWRVIPHYGTEPPPLKRMDVTVAMDADMHERYLAEMHEAWALLPKATFSVEVKEEKLKRIDELRDRLAIVVARYDAYIPNKKPRH